MGDMAVGTPMETIVKKVMEAADMAKEWLAAKVAAPASSDQHPKAPARS